MPVFHFTLHAYRSWHEDHPRGYVQRGKRGIQPPNPQLAAYRNSIAKHPEVRFTPDQMGTLLDAVETTCQRKNWTAFAAAATASHIHAVVSWNGVPSADNVQAGLKSGLGFCLSKAKGTTGNRWFSRGGLPERVEDHAHLVRLLHDYLPRHATEQAGQFRLFKDESEAHGLF